MTGEEIEKAAEEYATGHVTPGNDYINISKKEDFLAGVKLMQDEICKLITDADRVMCFSTMREGEIYDVQEVFRRHGYKYSDELQGWEPRD